METGPEQPSMEAYASTVRSLFRPTPRSLDGAAPLEAFRSGGELPTEFAAEQAETLSDILENAGEATLQVLESGRPADQEGAEVKLLAQAEAQIDAAYRLLALAEKQAFNEKHLGSYTAAVGEVRSADPLGLQDSMNRLAAALEMPAAAAFAVDEYRALTVRPTRREAALRDLQKDIAITTEVICSQTAEICERSARLLIGLDPEVWVKAAGTISKEFGEGLEKILVGIGSAVRRLVRAAVRILIQAYDLILSLLGKDLEAAARKRLAEWIADLKDETDSSARKGLIEALVERLFAPKSILADVEDRAEKTKAGVEAINHAGEEIDGLSSRYAQKLRFVKGTLTAIGLVNALKLPALEIPQLKLLAAATAFAVMAYTLYSGYDHVDSGRVEFSKRYGFDIPGRVKGVHRIVTEVLA